jgi:hypothetical protein
MVDVVVLIEVIKFSRSIAKRTGKYTGGQYV